MWEQGLSRAEEKRAWQDYIDFEISAAATSSSSSSDRHHRGAKLLYERALISLDKDRHFWLQYIRFIEKTIRDPQLVRAKFENRIKMTSVNNKFETLELLME